MVKKLALNIRGLDLASDARIEKFTKERQNEIQTKLNQPSSGLQFASDRMSERTDGKARTQFRSKQNGGIQTDAKTAIGPGSVADRAMASVAMNQETQLLGAQLDTSIDIPARRVVADQLVKDLCDAGIKNIQIEFTDLHGNLKSYTYPVNGDLADDLAKGITFDGSSIPGFTSVSESDLRLLPDLTSMVKYNCLTDSKGAPILRAGILADVRTKTGAPHPSCPRSTLKNLEAALPQVFLVSPEIEFFLIPSAIQAQIDQGTTKPSDVIYNGEYAHHPFDAEDGSDECKAEILDVMAKLSFMPEKAHGEVTKYQHEITMKCTSASQMADRLVRLRPLISKIARKYGLQATFKPKPFEGVNGSGGHTNHSIMDPRAQGVEQNLFYSAEGLALLSDTAREFLAGTLRSISGLTALFNADDNSYERMKPGFEAPSFGAWGRSNRTCTARVPVIGKGQEKQQRVELRSPDLMLNPHLSYLGLMTAGLSGIRDGLKLQAETTENLFNLTDAQVAKRGIPKLPGSKAAALDAFAKDAELLAGLGDEMHQAYIDLKSGAGGH